MDPLIVMLAVLALAAILFIFRASYRIIDPNKNSDADFHLVIARDIRKNGFRIPDKTSQTALSGVFAYPCFVHFLLALFPTHYYTRIERFFSPIIDVLFFCALAILVPLDVLSVSEYLIVGVLFTVTPQFMRRDLAHGWGFSARKPGILLQSVALITFLGWVESGSVALLGISVLFVAGVLLTSRFSTQALVAIGGALAITTSIISLGWLLAGFITAVVVSGGFYIRVLRQHIWFSYRYAVSKQYKFLYDGYKSFDTIKNILRIRSVSDAWNAVMDSILLRGIVTTPIAGLATLTVLAFQFGYGQPTLPAGYVPWFVTSACLFVLTSLYHLRFLGQAERYLEHAFVPAAVIVVYGLRTLPQMYTILVVLTGLVGLAICGINIGLVYFSNDSEHDAEFEEIVTALNEREKGVVITQPRWLGKRVAWRTNHQVTDGLGTFENSKDTINIRQRLFPEKEGWVTTEVEWLDETFSPDWILFDRSSKNAPGLTPPEEEGVVQNGGYELYSFETIVNEHQP